MVGQEEAGGLGHSRHRRHLQGRWSSASLQVGLSGACGRKNVWRVTWEVDGKIGIKCGRTSSYTRQD